MEKGKAACIYTLQDLSSNIYSPSSYTASKSHSQGWTAESAVKFIIALLLF